MANEDILNCLILRGQCSANEDEWQHWLETSLEFLSGWKCSPTHMTAKGEKFPGGKVKSFNPLVGRVREALSNGTSISDLAIYSLPAEFRQAAFDYDLVVGRDSQSIYVFADSRVIGLDDLMEFADGMARSCNVESTEVFELSRRESPFMILCGTMSKSKFKSLRILDGSSN